METIKINPLKITVREGLDRYRQNMSGIKDLAKSLKRFGNILPVVITEENELIDGGRRVAAAIEAGIDITCVYRSAIDTLEMRELELEANLHREDFTPAEKAAAIADLHKLMQEKHGVSSPGASGGWTTEDTAAKLKVSKGSVIEHLKIHQAIEAFPELANVKKASDIKKAVKALTKLVQVSEGLKKNEENIKDKGYPFELHQADAIDFISKVETGRVDVLLTDPLYGIEHDRIAIGAAGETGGRSSIGYKFDDSVEPALRSYDYLAQESYRFTSPVAQGYIFLAIEHFNNIKDLFKRAGWGAYVKPLIWIKRETGQCNAPTHWPSDCYEAILYIRKDQARLVKEGMPNWIECTPVLPSERIHPYEKPVQLLDNLLKRSALPGQTLFDPFMGSASAIEAGVARKMYCIGVDNSAEAYSFAAKRMADYMKKRKES